MSDDPAAVAWITWHDNSEMLRRHLELVEMEDWEPPHYKVYLELGGGTASGGPGPPDPTFESLGEALAWARTRAGRVIGMGTPAIHPYMRPRSARPWLLIPHRRWRRAVLTAAVG